jgi:hypothetical protein
VSVDFLLLAHITLVRPIVSHFESHPGLPSQVIIIDMQ